MSEQLGEGTMGSQTETLDMAALVATAPDLLLLLAETRQQLEQARADLADAESRTSRAEADADTLQMETEGASLALTTAEARIDELEAERRHDQAAAASAEARIDELHRELLDATAREQGARTELQDLLGSRSWRITRPIRALTGGVTRRSTGAPTEAG